MRTRVVRGERVSGPTEIEGVTVMMDGRRLERREQVEVTSPRVVRYKVENKAAAAAAAAATGEGGRGGAHSQAGRVGERANCEKWMENGFLKDRSRVPIAPRFAEKPKYRNTKLETETPKIQKTSQIWLEGFLRSHEVLFRPY